MSITHYKSLLYTKDTFTCISSTLGRTNHLFFKKFTYILKRFYIYLGRLHTRSTHYLGRLYTSLHTISNFYTHFYRSLYKSIQGLYTTLNFLTRFYTGLHIVSNLYTLFYTSFIARYLLDRTSTMAAAIVRLLTLVIY